MILELKLGFSGLTFASHLPNLSGRGLEKDQHQIVLCWCIHFPPDMLHRSHRSPYLVNFRNAQS